jgi:hypothetical protein
MKEFYPFMLEHQIDYLFFPKTEVGKILTDMSLDTPTKIDRLEDIVLNSEDCTRDFNSIFRRCENPDIAGYFARTYANDFRIFINNMTPLEVMQYPYFSPQQRAEAFSLRKLTSGVLADILGTALLLRDNDVIEFALRQPKCRPPVALLAAYLEKIRKPRATVLELMLAHHGISPSPFFETFVVTQHPRLLRLALMNPLASDKDLAFVARELFVDRQVSAIKKSNLPAKAIDLIVRHYLYDKV